MVIPWVGFPLSQFLKRCEPTGNAKFVAFTTLHDPRQMPGQRVAVLDWPDVEGLRVDEAMHPLTILSWDSTAKSCPTRTAHTFGSPCRESKASSTRSRS